MLETKHHITGREELPTNPYSIELVYASPGVELPQAIQERIEQIISWSTPHMAEWYPVPGRTLILNTDGYQIKIKGAGFHNPKNISYAGTRRTTTDVPESDMPIPPLERLFERDLIHADPSPTYPHHLQSTHSTFAPIGGMTLAGAQHDQEMLHRLSSTRIPSNRPLACYRHNDLLLNGAPMGVSVSLVPEDALSMTAYHLYLPDILTIKPEALDFLQIYSGHGDQFMYEDPCHRLEVLAKLAQQAGTLLYDFSTKAGLYRFSGGPDNWNIRSDMQAPLYFSDVDTSRKLESIPPEQRGWEVLRNVTSAIHNWYYYFLPTLSQGENRYTLELLQQQNHDFVRRLLIGFFSDKNSAEIDHVSKNIWRFFDHPLIQASHEQHIGLRKGEQFLQRYYPRPIFYFVMFRLLSDLIQDSEFQKQFPATDTSEDGIRDYVDMSIQHPSHTQMFPQYSQVYAQHVVNNFT